MSRLYLVAAEESLVDLAIAEYHRRVGRGESPDPEAFCELFPTCKEALRKAMEPPLARVRG